MIWEKGRFSRQAFSPPPASCTSSWSSTAPLKISLLPMRRLSPHSGTARQAASCTGSPCPTFSLTCSENVKGFSCTASS